MPSYAERITAELSTFADQETIHDLSPIMAYYAERVVAPRLKALGYEGTYDFFASNIARLGWLGRPISIVSYGCGNGELELTVGKLLDARGMQGFHFHCIDINGEMLARAERAVSRAGLGDRYSFAQEDASAPCTTAPVHDVHIAFHSLHHVQNLEGLFARIDAGMDRHSVFLTNDMVGRNGHMRWPESLVVVEKLWSLLPDRYRYNHAFRRLETEFVNFDCSDVGFEGIRAEDVLPLLAKLFDFEECVHWGGAVDPFVDRSFGPNFDPNRASDRRFMDLAMGLEVDLQRAGVITPTQILARMRRKGAGTRALDVTPILRLGPPERMPSVNGIALDLSGWSEIVSHTFSGSADEPILGEGFWEWEVEPGHRWARRTFSLRFEAPPEAVPYRCHLSVCFAGPPPGAGGDVDVFVNGVLVSHIVNGRAEIAADPDHRLALSFVTLGGPMVVTFVLADPERASGPDERELGAIVRSLSVQAERG